MNSEAPQSAPKKPDDVELVPLGRAPLDLTGVDVTLASDPLPALEQLRRSQKRWKLLALVSIVAVVVLGVVSVLQFAGTFITCRMLAQAQLEAERTREEAQRALEENRKIHHDLLADRREALSLRGQLAQLVAEWETSQQQRLRALERDPMVEGRRSEIVEALGKEGDRLIEQIRREVEDHAAFLEAVIHESFHGEAVNPLVPRQPRPKVED